MTNYHHNTDLLALYVQLTPWVQAFLALVTCVLVLGMVYLFKEIVATLARPFHRPMLPPRMVRKYAKEDDDH